MQNQKITAKENFSEQLLDALVFFRQAHGKQAYKDGLLYWHHLYTVATILKTALDETKEMDDETKKALIIAAFGHDSLEDTTATAEEVEKKFGLLVLEFINGLTNKVGDYDTRNYEEQVINAREEIRLLKMCDSIDNYHRVAYRVTDNGAEWLEEKVLPIMENMYKKILETNFVKYPKTAERLKMQLRTAHALAFNAIGIAKHMK